MSSLGAPGEGHGVSEWDGDALLAEQQAATFLSVTPRTLQKWRGTGSGPPFIHISRRCVRYRRSDLIDWISERLRVSTSG